MDHRERGRLVLVCFDPGETTGYGRFSLSNRILLSSGVTAALREANRDGRIQFNQFGLRGDPGLQMNEEASASHMALLTRIAWVEEIHDPSVDSFVVVIEDFILFREERSRSLLAPVRVTARYEQEMKGSRVRIAKQSSSDAKNVVTDARLRRWDMWNDTEGGAIGTHSRDALRHGILFARRYASHISVRRRFSPGLLPADEEGMGEDDDQGYG